MTFLPGDLLVIKDMDSRHHVTLWSTIVDEQQYKPFPEYVSTSEMIGSFIVAYVKKENEYIVYVPMIGIRAVTPRVLDSYFIPHTKA